MAKESTGAVSRLLSSVYEISAPWVTKFYCLGVTNCNADKFASFSQDANIDLEILTKKSGNLIPVSLCEIFEEMVRELIKAKGDYKSSDNLKVTTNCLESFTKNVESDGGHLKCLKEMKRRSQNDDTKKISEAEIQAVLACHLFSPLLVEGEVILDQTCYKDKVKPQCPFCVSKLATGTTTFGCRKLWHGRADMVIKGKHVRKVVTCKSKTEDEGQGEPAHKKPKIEDEDLKEDLLNTTVEDNTALGEIKILGEKTDKMLVAVDKPFIQSITHTLVNAFFVVKGNKTYENYFIPSFLVSDEQICINFYNVREDVLLSQAYPFELFDVHDNIESSTIFAVWLALNSDRFPVSGYPDKLFGKSKFRDQLIRKGVLEEYKNNVESEFSSGQKPKCKKFPQTHDGNFYRRLAQVVSELESEKNKDYKYS